MRAVVVAHGDAVDGDRRQIEGADLVVAADGGALRLASWDVMPHVVIGDLDSLDEEHAAALERSGARVIRHAIAKDETDTELALGHALAAGASEITLLALFGGPRLDHAVANAMLLADERLRGLRVRAVFGGTTVRALFGGGTLALERDVGDIVSLVPAAGDAWGVRTEGLRFPLRGETLRTGAARGVSNVIDRVPASVSLERGRLLVFEIARGGAS